ncbi:MAG: alpha-L-fucosidase [Phycisphaerae bacterium]|jgi:alpha-L-fucosidase|nr:alpha-L-fucosidase [Phycisphaerae bacterium]
MSTKTINRRRFIQYAGHSTTAVCAVAAGSARLAAQARTGGRDPAQGDQRLSIEQLRQWESLRYGMFIHFGMSTYVQNELPDGKAPASTYAPDKLDVDQWISVARDAGMKYAVLTTKHVAGHCLWPSKHTSYSVANSGNKTDVVEQFVKVCEKRGVLPGFYYCSWDNHNRFGSRTPSDPNTLWEFGMNKFAEMERRTSTQPSAPLPAYTTSVYQGFQTMQITELLTQYGPIAETWIDIPGVLGRGYREYLYNHIARLQPQTVIMMNSGISSGESYPVDYAWPSDIIAIERRLPPGKGHETWRTIEDRRYYMPGEVCDPIGKDWFFTPDDRPRSDDALLDILQNCLDRGVNLLLDVPPDKHGLIPDMHLQALQRLRANAKI